MRLAGDDTIVTIGGEAIRLRPSLRAAMRLERQHGSFRALLDGLQNGSLAAFGSILVECGDGRQGCALLTRPDDEPAFSRLNRIAPALAALVLELADIGPPNAPEPDAGTSGGRRISFSEALSDLFGIATGVLGWSRADAYAATPAEIHVALDQHVAMVRAQNGLPPAERQRHGPDDDVLDVAGLDALRNMGGIV